MMIITNDMQALTFTLRLCVKLRYIIIMLNININDYNVTFIVVVRSWKSYIMYIFALNI